jgi:acyl-CoA synthetase (AMP-forming)/AMP-acid ligase II
MNLLYVLRYADRMHARAPAVQDGDLNLTWAEYAARVRRVAGGLSGLGAASGERLAVLMLNSPPYLDCR